MVTLEFAQVLELKKAVAEHFKDKVHFHDACGGQYFSLDQNNKDLENFIIAYFKYHNINVIFSANRLTFTLEEKKKC